MAKNKQIKDFFQNALTEKEAQSVKGGKNYVPSNTGSMGYINWDDVGIRESGWAVSASSGTIITNSKHHG